MDIKAKFAALKDGAIEVAKGSAQEVLSHMAPVAPSTIAGTFRALDSYHNKKLEPIISANNTLEENEFKASMQYYKEASNSTLNPFKLVWRLLRSVFVSGKKDNLSKALKRIRNDFDSNQYGTGNFANQAWDELKADLDKLLHRKQGFLSRLFNPNKLDSNPRVQDYIATLSSIAARIPDLDHLKMAYYESRNNPYPFIRSSLGNKLKNLLNSGEKLMRDYHRNPLPQTV